MAKRQHRLDRIRIAARRATQEVLASLSVAAARGRLSAPRVVANSLPKSGTNLLYRFFFYLGPFRRKGLRTLMYWDGSARYAARRIRHIRNGQFLVAHVRDDPLIFSTMRERHVKPVMLIRDPRKIILSHVHYVTSIDLTHKSHSYFASLKSQAERIDAVIHGVPGIVIGIEELLGAYANWCSDPEILVVRYEDLVGVHGGGTHGRQVATIHRILDHLEVAATAVDVDALAGRLFSTRAPTYRTATIGGWEREFSREQLDLIESKLGPWLQRFDYPIGSRT